MALIRCSSGSGGGSSTIKKYTLDNISIPKSGGTYSFTISDLNEIIVMELGTKWGNVYTFYTDNDSIVSGAYKFKYFNSSKVWATSTSISMTKSGNVFTLNNTDSGYAANVSLIVYYT